MFRLPSLRRSRRSAARRRDIAALGPGEPTGTRSHNNRHQERRRQWQALATATPRDRAKPITRNIWTILKACSPEGVRSVRADRAKADRVIGGVRPARRSSGRSMSQLGVERCRSQPDHAPIVAARRAALFEALLKALQKTSACSGLTLSRAVRRPCAEGDGIGLRNLVATRVTRSVI
jgi:hypothetical protein